MQHVFSESRVQKSLEQVKDWGFAHGPAGEVVHLVLGFEQQHSDQWQSIQTYGATRTHLANILV